MARLFRNELERKKGLWRRVVDLALTDVHVVAGRRANATLEALEERLLAADFGVSVTMRLVARAEEALRRGKGPGRRPACGDAARRNPGDPGKRARCLPARRRLWPDGILDGGSERGR